MLQQTDWEGVVQADLQHAAILHPGQQRLSPLWALNYLHAAAPNPIIVIQPLLGLAGSRSTGLPQRWEQAQSLMARLARMGCIKPPARLQQEYGGHRLYPDIAHGSANPPLPHQLTREAEQLQLPLLSHTQDTLHNNQPPSWLHALQRGKMAEREGRRGQHACLAKHQGLGCHHEQVALQALGYVRNGCGAKVRPMCLCDICLCSIFGHTMIRGAGL